jgi:hypothetical protein
MEVAAGLEPAKTGFADQRLDHFGIATKPALNPVQTRPNLYPSFIPKTVPKLPSERLFTPIQVLVNY